MYLFPLESHGIIIAISSIFYFIFCISCQWLYAKLVEKLCSFSWSNSWKKVDTVTHILGILNLLQLRLSLCVSHLLSMEGI